ncbi:hypothetical protein QTP70_007014 [Hemibagrus guttatus]|uniref:Uncharacterized protein n=1 Tax=Hemibagrus guttatus TaxID=175788 RepID=A0AAE0UKX0_9TELE|nr:hypothetical protein QTP70_007014 [Hemibagrus guttatus]
MCRVRITRCVSETLAAVPPLLISSKVETKRVKKHITTVYDSLRGLACVIALIDVGGRSSEVRRSVVVKKELSRKAKLSIYQSIYAPTLTYGHELWVMTERALEDDPPWPGVSPGLKALCSRILILLEEKEKESGRTEWMDGLTEEGLMVFASSFPQQERSLALPALRHILRSA